MSLNARPYFRLLTFNTRRVQTLLQCSQDHPVSLQTSRNSASDFGHFGNSFWFDERSTDKFQQLTAVAHLLITVIKIATLVCLDIACFGSLDVHY